VKDVPMKLGKEELKDYAALEERYLLSKKTHEITVFTEGMLCLDKTLMGVIEVDPKEILVDGIRKELVNKVSEMFHNTFKFSRQGSFEELDSKLNSLMNKFAGLKKAFEYIQDFLNIFGEKIWREEISRIITVNVERESATLIYKKFSFEEEDNDLIQIPYYEPDDE
jgi:WASH complex subunit strumpellin